MSHIAPGHFDIEIVSAENYLHRRGYQAPVSFGTSLPRESFGLVPAPKCEAALELAPGRQSDVLLACIRRNQKNTGGT